MQLQADHIAVTQIGLTKHVDAKLRIHRGPECEPIENNAHQMEA